MKALEGEMVATSAKAQMLGGVLRTVLNVGLVLLISTLVSLPNIIKNISDSIKQERQEAADSAKQQIDDINDLRTQYYELSEQVKTDSSVKEQLTTVTKQLLKRLGLEKQAIEDLSDDYERLNGNINEATISSLQEAESSLRATIADNSSVEDKNFSTNGGYIVSNKFGKKTIQTVSALKEYREIVNDLQKEFSNFDFQDSMITFDVSNVDTIKQSYQDVSDLLAYMNEEYGDNTQQSTLYHSLAAIQTELKTDIDKYDTAVSNLNDNIAQQTILSGLIGREIPKTTEEFNKFKQELIDSIYYINDEGDAVTKFAGVTQDNMELAENAILSVLSTMPEFKKFFEIGSNDGNNGSSLQSKLSGLNSELEELKETTDFAFSNQSTLQSAFDKIQEGASLSADEVRKLVEICPELATEFDKTADGYTISSNALIKANSNMLKSTRDSVQEQINGYQEVIDKYEEYQKQITASANIPGMPNSAKEAQKNALSLGISEEEYSNAVQQVNSLKLIFDMLGISLKTDTDNAEELAKRLEELSKTSSTLASKAKTLSSAFKEQNENGKLSVDTVLSLIENGYSAALMYDTETGAIKLNAQAYIELAKAEIEEQIAALEAEKAARIKNTVYENSMTAAAYAAHGEYDLAESFYEVARAAGASETEINAQIAALEELKSHLGEVTLGKYGDTSGSTTDTVKQDFDDYMQEYEKLHERGLMSDKDYYDKLEYANETFYKNCADHLDDYISNETKIYNARKTQFKSDTDDMITDLEKQFERGEISAEQLAKAIADIRDTRYGEGSTYVGTEFANDEYKSLTEELTGYTDDEYNEALGDLKKKNDGALKSEEQFIEDWIALNDDTWKGVNPKQWEENYNEIADYTKDFYKQLLDDGVFDVSQYTQKVNTLFYQLKGLGIDLGANWLADALNDTKDISFDRLKEKLSADGDTDINDVIADVDKLAKKDIKLFSDTPETLKKNGEDIFNSLVSSAQDALSKGLISPERYLEIIDTFADTWQEKLSLTQGVIDEAKNALEVDDWMDDWDKKHGYDDDKDKNNFKLRQDRIEELRNKIVEVYGVDGVKNVKAYNEAIKDADEQQKQLNEDIYAKTKEDLSADGDKALDNLLSDAETLWNDTLSLFSDNDIIKENAQDIYSSVSEALKDAFEKGIITADEYETQIRDWGNKLNLTEADITDALVDTYEYRANALQKANDGSLASERKYIADMKSLNFSTYGDENSDFYDPNTYVSNLRDITDHQLDVLEKALNNGEISVQEYANSVVEIFKDADVLGADYVSEKLDDIDKVRAEREKTYWEQQKELMEDYYDKQIKEIEETQKAKEKENKLEELHLKLIKARQSLEEAKNNRNQLVFHNGTFEYTADQDAIMSAEEEVANTLKEIENEKLQEQIDLLEEQKDAALGFYDQILDEIDFYLNKTLPLSESDQEELAKIRNSDYAQYARDKRDGNFTANSDNEKIAEDALNQTDTAEETKQSVSDIAKNVFDIAKVVANGFNFENLVRALGGNPTAETVKNFQDSYNATLVGKQIVPSTLPSNITNNSSTTNNATKVINVGGITVKLELAVQSLDDFVNNKIDMAMTKLGNAIEQEMPKILAKA